MFTPTYIFDIFQNFQPRFSVFCLHWNLPAAISLGFSWEDCC